VPKKSSAIGAALMIWSASSLFPPGDGELSMDVPRLQLGISDAALMAAYRCGVGGMCL